MENSLSHHGIRGMKWGKRNGPPYPLTQSSKSQAERKASTGKTKGSEKQTTEASSKKKVSDMSDSELKEAISRLQLEKQYKDLTKSESVKKSAKGKEFVMDVLEKSGKNIATQFTTYIMGEALNSVAGKEIVNPKKGQKDK